MQKGGKRLRRSPWACRRQTVYSRLLAWCLVFALTAPLCGTIYVYAEEVKDSTLCVHHMDHTEECGYSAPSAGVPCGHVHDEACGYLAPVEGAPCGHVHSEECGFAEAVEGSPCGHVHDEACGYREATDEIPCDMGCQETGEDGEILHQEGCAYTPAIEGAPCNHIHDEFCGYAKGSEGVPCNHVHNETCGFAEDSEGVPCSHVHDETCGYTEPAGGAPCTFLCGLCVTSWQWADEEETLVQSEETGVWGLSLPGASQDAPLTREALEALLPTAVYTETAAGPQTVELSWNLEQFPESAWEGSYTLSASLTGEYVLTESAPRLEVLVDLGGGETYDFTQKFINEWQFIAADGTLIPMTNQCEIVITDNSSAAAVRRQLEARLPQYIRAWCYNASLPDLKNAGFIEVQPNGGKTWGNMPIQWNLSKLPTLLEFEKEYAIVASTAPNPDSKIDVIVNSNTPSVGSKPDSSEDPTLLTLKVTLKFLDLHLSEHTVPAATPLATTVNLFDYWVETDGVNGNDLLIGKDYHWNANYTQNVLRSGVSSWNQGINKGRLLLFGDGNIHAGFWNKGAGAISDYGKTYAGMEGIVKPVLENGYPVMNTEDMNAQITGFKGIADWELCGDELDSGPGGSGLNGDNAGAAHDSNEPKQNLSTTVINGWNGDASLEYLFNPDITNSYKRSYEDVKGLFQLDSRGYYYYDMRRNFAEFDGRDQFILYDAPAVDRTDSSYENGGFTGGRSIGNFFPFNKGAQVFTGIEDGKLVNSEIIQSHNGRNKGGTPMNHHLGMTLTVDFRQPLNGQINMGVDLTGAPQMEPMSFQFSGDDDVWIFVDDVLVLDLGGIHSEIFGTINFATGDVKIGQSWKTNGFPYDDDPLNPGEIILDLAELESSSIQTTNLKALFTAAGKADDFAWGEGINQNTFASDTDHTLKMFYLERGNYDSSLAVRFNLQPQLYQQIKKVDQNGEALEGVEFQLFPAEETPDPTAIECLYTDSDVHNGDTFYVRQQPNSSALATLVTDGDGESLFEREVNNRTGGKKTEPFNFADRDEVYYILRETRTPEGYRAQPIDIVLRYDKDTSMLTVANRWTTGAYACSVSNIIGVGRLTYGHFDNGSIRPNSALPVGETKQSGGLVIAVPILYQKTAKRWEALYGSNLGGFKAVAIADQIDADSWRWAVLEAALRQSMDVETPDWYFDWDEGNNRLVGTLSGLPGLASRYQVNNLNGDMRMVYGIIEPAALEKLEINISAPVSEKTAAQLRYEALASYAAEHGIEATLSAIKGTSVSDNASGTGFSFLNTDQFNRNFRSLIYIPNEQRELWVQKIDQDGKPRNGALFGLYDNAACASAPVSQGTTATVTMPDGSEQEGILIFSPKDNRNPGYAKMVWAASSQTQYYLKEINAPAGCNLNPTVIPVVVGTYSIYADAGQAGDGVSVMAGVGRLTQTMRQYAMGNDVDITLQDITAFGQYQPSSNTSALPSDWQNMKLDTTVDKQVLRFMNLHFGKNAMVDYGLHDQDGGKFFKPFFVSDEGFIRARVQQNQDTQKYEEFGATSDINKDDLKGTNLTNLFSLLNVVVVTDQTSPDTETGKLTISKQVEGEGLDAADYTKNFQFTLTLTDASGKPLSGSYNFYGTDKAGTLKNGDVFPLHHDESITILGLPVGTKFTVTETVDSADVWYVFPKSGTVGGTIANGQTSSAQFRNRKTPWPDVGSLTISKTVTGGGDRSKDFTFTVTLKGSTGAELTGTFSYDGSKKGTISSGGTITLRDGQSVTITGLPAGTAYTVTEAKADGYTTTSSGETGTIPNGSNADAAFNNYIEPEKPAPGTGSLTLRKTVTGSGDRSKDFTFTVRLSAGGSYPYSGSKSGSIASGGTITLRDGQSITITGLPLGTTYSVTEQEANQDGYTTSSSGESGTISGSHTAAFINGKSGGGGTPETPPPPPPPETPPPETPETPPPETPPELPPETPPEIPPETPPETPERPQLPDPNDPNSPPTITIWEDGVPTTYVRIWDPEKEEYVYVPEDEVPLGYLEVPETGEGFGFWKLSTLLSLLGLATLRFGRKKEEI